MNSAAKDDEVDVIAWRPSNDSLPGTAYLYGQAASGGNWPDKPLSDGKVRSFQDKWYDIRPFPEPLRSIFIPFCPYPEVIDKSVEDYKRLLACETLNYGIFFTRYRLPYFVQKNMAEGVGASNIDAHIKKQLEEWRREWVQRLRQRA